jgi:uncharacterized protein (DUF736 family)
MASPGAISRIEFIDIFSTLWFAIVLSLALLIGMYTGRDGWVILSAVIMAVTAMVVVMWDNHPKTKATPLYRVASTVFGGSVMLLPFAIGVAWDQRRDTGYNWIFLVIEALIIIVGGFVANVHSARGFIPKMAKK